jgi:hypothetical protein
MFDAQFIQRIKKHLSRKETPLEHPDTIGKQLMVKTPPRAEKAPVTWSQPSASEEQMLLYRGFTQEEILALSWLRQWYQNGGSDRVVIIRHLEFLRRLVRDGVLEP